MSVAKIRTHHLGQIKALEMGTTVTVCGWVEHKRDHGGVLFFDLRDRYGLLQVVIDPELSNSAKRTSLESVIQVKGELKKRSEETFNAALELGHVELHVSEFTLLSRAKALPISLSESDTKEELRLSYRYLDLRRSEMQNNLKTRAKVVAAIRSYLQAHEFLDIETPFLTRSTPEGARDYVVPSRVYPKHFFALPQSPQIFKQLLMVAGMDRYYQIVRCFRDEDLRSDRQPEFTQLDLEMSFATQPEIMQCMEGMIHHVFDQVLGENLVDPFLQMSYADSIALYGTDRPDLRNPLKLCDLSELMKESDFKVFADAAKDPAGKVVVLRVPNANEIIGRQQIDRYTEQMRKMGAAGLAYVRVQKLTTDGLKSPIIKFLGDTIINKMIAQSQAQPGDLLFFGAGEQSLVNATMSAFRDQLGKDLDLLEGKWAFLWITDFPLFEKDPQSDALCAVHHPFTSPIAWDDDPLKMHARAYDLVLNGAEIGGGSIRNHQADQQLKLFKLLGFSEDSARAQFGFFLNALEYGAPPHGGMAFGIDRIAAIACNCQSIRDVIAFPKTQRSSCLLTGAPDLVEEKQLKDLGLRLARG